MARLTRTQQVSDLAVAAVVLAITTMLLVPLPTPLLDVLLAFNLSFAILLLLVGLYMPSALALLAFPSLLLLTTLFRLALNVASTRLILTEADAGQVIEAFGTFLIRGEIVVGLIIFVIITAVNFIVVARGSARVSEVAARFALDALPGKQLAIDADLRSGLISAEEAQERREDLRKESQLYGAMDGAMKFVQGDAIAGIFIIFTNIVGGLYVGIANGMSIADAVHTYTVLTVGDGLVTQIPALLISICAGVVVTRVSSGKDATLGTDLGAQLFARPATVAFAGGLLWLIAFLPGLPAVPFIAVGGLFLGTGLWLQHSGAVARQLPPLGRALSLLPPPIEVEKGLDTTALTVQLDGSLARSIRAHGSRAHEMWAQVREEVAREVGIALPDLRIESADHLMPGEYRVNFGSMEIDRGLIPLDCEVVEMSPCFAESVGLSVIRVERHPLHAAEVFWTPGSAALRRAQEAGQLRVHDPFSFIALRVAQFFRCHPEEVLTLTAVHAWVKQFEKRHPGLIAEALNKSYITIPRLTETFQELVRQGVSVRDFSRVLEAVAAYCSNHATLDSEDTFDLDDLVRFVRTSFRRQLVASSVSVRQVLRVITLSEAGEARLRRMAEEFDRDEPSSLRPFISPLGDSLRSLLEPVLHRGVLPIALVVPQEVREITVQVVRALELPIQIFASGEVDGLGVKVETVGTWAP